MTERGVKAMELFLAAFAGGLAGTGLMDVAELVMKRYRITSASA